MEIQPNSLHQRTPLLIGSKEMVVEAQSLITKTKEKITEFSQ
jgi:fructose-1,6-bisphosphatase I